LIGREEAEFNESEANSEMRSKIHDQEEVCFQETASETHDLEEECLWDHEEVASVAINYLLNFAFYMQNKVVKPNPQQITTLDFEEVFEHKMIEMTTSKKPTIMQTLTKGPNGMLPFTKHLGTCATEVCGTKSSAPPTQRKTLYQVTMGVQKPNVITYFVHD